LRTIDLFGWTLCPFKIPLVLTSMMKSYFDGVETKRRFLVLMW